MSTFLETTPLRLTSPLVTAILCLAVACPRSGPAEVVTWPAAPGTAVLDKLPCLCYE